MLREKGATACLNDIVETFLGTGMVPSVSSVLARRKEQELNTVPTSRTEGGIVAARRGTQYNSTEM